MLRAAGGTSGATPLYEFLEAQRQQLKLPFESLTERKEKLRQAGESRGGRGEEGE